MEPVKTNINLVALAESVTDAFLARDFVSSCVMHQLKESVKTNQTITDIPLTEDDISLMKKWKLSENNYAAENTDEQHASMFEIKCGNEDVWLSNRQSTAGELRGSVLRQVLDKYKSVNPEMTLYDALDCEVKNPKSVVAYALNPTMLQVGYESFPSLLQQKEGGNTGLTNYGCEVADKIINGFTELSLACMDFVKEGRRAGISDEALTEGLERFVTENKRKIIQSALADRPLNRDEFHLELLKQTPALQDYYQARLWIKNVRSLATKYTGTDKSNIDVVINTAEKMLNSHISDAPSEQQQAITKNFLEAVGKVQSLHTEKLNRKNVLNVFLFIPSIVNLIKTKGEHFWFKSTVKETVPELLKERKAQKADDTSLVPKLR